MSDDVLASPMTFRAETRLQHSVLAAAEKRTLIWLARRMPAAVTSDHLTALALAAMAGVGLSFWLAGTRPAGPFLVAAFLALNWFGDSLDGTLARVRDQQRPRYGYYLDHVVDAVGALFLFGGLALSDLMSAPVAAIVLLAYFLLCLEVYLATHSLGTFRMSYFGVGPTELRILLVVGLAATRWFPTATLFGHAMPAFDAGGLVAAGGLVGTFVYSTARHLGALARLEPRPARRP